MSAHPKCSRPWLQVLEAASAAGKATGILATVEADARRYLDMGMSFVAVGSDLGVLRMHSQALCDKYRDPSRAPIASHY